MPCTYTGSLEGDQIYASDQQIKKLRKDLDKVTSLLCQACSELANDDNQLENGELNEWYQKHLEEDAKRLIEEYRTRSKEKLQAMRRRLMRQLTVEELRALGVIE